MIKQLLPLVLRQKSIVLFLLLLVLPIQPGSMTAPPKDFVFSVPPIIHSFQPDISLKVGLVLSDDFKNAVWISDEHKINFHIGAVFSEKAKEVSTAVFSKVVVADTAQTFSPTAVNAMLEPKLVSYERSRPVFGTSTTIDTVVIQWTLTGPNENLIWVDSIQVDGESSVTTSEATKAALTLNPWKVGKQAADRGMEMAAERFFNDSVSAMKLSVEIRAFADKVSASN
ncbi:MAG: hypothetical protein ABW124_13080 [Candidatus Thiodiazotropha sp. 6PLUC9]